MIKSPSPPAPPETPAPQRARVAIVRGGHTADLAEPGPPPKPETPARRQEG